jgi:hypothetical protein
MSGVIEGVERFETSETWGDSASLWGYSRSLWFLWGVLIVGFLSAGIYRFWEMLKRRYKSKKKSLETVQKIGRILGVIILAVWVAVKVLSMVVQLFLIPIDETRARAEGTIIQKVPSEIVPQR